MEMDEDRRDECPVTDHHPLEVVVEVVVKDVVEQKVDGRITKLLGIFVVTKKLLSSNTSTGKVFTSKCDILDSGKSLKLDKQFDQGASNCHSLHEICTKIDGTFTERFLASSRMKGKAQS